MSYLHHVGAMDERLDLQLRAYAVRHAGARCVDDDAAACVLLVDERWPINFHDDIESGRLHAYAGVGQIRRAKLPGSEEAEWVTRTRTVDGFTWSVACDAQSGDMVVTASLQRHSAADEFEAWLSCVLERIRQVGSSLSPDRPISMAAGLPTAALPHTAMQSQGWLKG